MPSTLATNFAALFAVLHPQGDPEQTPAGRTHYLGREIAQTMHWTGAPWLMRATREDEENGALLRQWLAVRPGQAICDLGCGNGYHTIPLAEAVGPTGTVYAVDLQPEMLVLLERRSERRELDNLRFVEATVDDPKLAPASCDLVLMVDVYHELSHPVRVMQHVRSALKAGGQVVLIEFRAEDPDVPIKPEHMMSKAQVVREMASHGFRLLRECDELPWQHAMAFAVAGAADVGPRLAAHEVLRAFLRAAGGDDARIVALFLGPDLAVRDLPALSGDLRAELRAGPDGFVLADLRAADGSRLAHGRDEVVMRADRAGRWLVDAVRERQAIVRAHGASRPFVAMHTATGGGNVADQVALARELAFDGVAWSLDRLPEVRRSCEAHGGDLFSAYAVLDVGAGVDERLPPLRAAMTDLVGGPGMLWLALRHGELAPRDAAGDDAAIAGLRHLLAHADATGVEIALYPHHGCWLETTEHALRLCDRLDDALLGVCFNLCHFLRAHDVDVDPTALLTRCGERLLAVTVNGADVAGTDWRSLIQPLGSGDFDLRRLLQALDEVGFAGPVGLQGFGIPAPAREHLTASMAAWRAAQTVR